MNYKQEVKFNKKNISKAKYNELMYFCMQYADKKKDPNRVGEAELIEQTAIAADSTVYQYILKNVTQGIKYEYMDVPCGRRQFYESRSRFFYLLSQKR